MSETEQNCRSRCLLQSLYRAGHIPIILTQKDLDSIKAEAREEGRKADREEIRDLVDELEITGRLGGWTGLSDWKRRILLPDAR